MQLEAASFTNTAIGTDPAGVSRGCGQRWDGGREEKAAGPGTDIPTASCSQGSDRCPRLQTASVRGLRSWNSVAVRGCPFRDRVTQATGG